MAKIYIHFHQHLNSDPALPKELLGPNREMEHLKWSAPDDAGQSGYLLQLSDFARVEQLDDAVGANLFAPKLLNVRINSHLRPDSAIALPDDGEALDNRGKYCIACPDPDWWNVVETLRASGRSLGYAVLLDKGKGGALATGELNVHRQNGLAVESLAFWFEDFISRPGERRKRLQTRR